MIETETWRERLRAARERRGLSRKDAAQIAGVSPGLWRNVETGVQHVTGVGPRAYTTTPTTVAKMASAVGMDPLELVAAAGMDPEAVHLETLPGGGTVGDVRVIVIRGSRSTDEVLAEVRRILDDMEQ